MSLSDVMPVLGTLGLCVLFGVMAFRLLAPRKAKKQAADAISEPARNDSAAQVNRSQCDGYSAGTFYW